MRPIPATRLGDAHGLLRAIEKRGRLRTDEFVTEFNLDELFPPNLENALGRMRHFISFGRLAGLVKEDRGVVELTDVGKRYIRSGDADAPYDISAQQAEWLRRQLREKHMTDSIFHGLAIGLSLLASVPPGTRISTMDFGRSMAYLGRAGWDNENTLLIQGERHITLLTDVELIEGDHRLTPVGEQLRLELTLPVHMGLADLAAQLNPGGAAAVSAAAEQEFAAPAAEPQPEPPKVEAAPPPEPEADDEDNGYHTVIGTTTPPPPPIVPRSGPPTEEQERVPSTSEDPLLPFAGTPRESSPSGLTPGDPLGSSPPPAQQTPPSWDPPAEEPSGSAGPPPLTGDAPLRWGPLVDPTPSWPPPDEAPPSVGPPARDESPAADEQAVQPSWMPEAAPPAAEEVATPPSLPEAAPPIAHEPATPVAEEPPSVAGPEPPVAEEPRSVVEPAPPVAEEPTPVESAPEPTPVESAPEQAPVESAPPAVEEPVDSAPPTAAEPTPAEPTPPAVEEPPPVESAPPVPSVPEPTPPVPSAGPPVRTPAPPVHEPVVSGPPVASVAPPPRYSPPPPEPRGPLPPVASPPGGGFVDVATIRAAALSAGLRLPGTVYANVAAALAAGKHVILTGPPGAGKTSLAMAIARAAAQAGQAHGAIVLTGARGWDPAETVVAAAQQGRWVIADELDRAELEEALGALSTFLAGIPVALPSAGEAAPADGWRIIATAQRTPRASGALTRRFATIEVSAPSTDEIHGALHQAANGDATATRAAERLLRMTELTPLGTGVFLDAARHAAARNQATPTDDLTLAKEAFTAYIAPLLGELDEEQQRRVQHLLG